MARLSVMIPVQGQMREKKSSDHKKNWKENEDLQLLKKYQLTKHDCTEFRNRIAFFVILLQTNWSLFGAHTEIL